MIYTAIILTGDKNETKKIPLEYLYDTYYENEFKNPVYKFVEHSNVDSAGPLNIKKVSYDLINVRLNGSGLYKRRKETT